MQIEVDIKQIKDAPIDNATSLDKMKINKFKHELIRGNPTTYLVSGYRGVGKTSFIKTLVNEINLELSIDDKDNKEITYNNDDKFLGKLLTKFKYSVSKSKQNKDIEINEKGFSSKVFVHLNVGKYNGFSNILRNLIREVYWSISNGSEDVKKRLQINQKLFLEIELIYARTFQEIELKESDLENEENIKSFFWGADFRNLITRLSTFLLGSISFINYIKSGNWASYIVPIIILIGLLITFEYSKKKSKSWNIELSRKTFYDDEIAEFQLTRIISKLAELGIELVFIIDELDKIEKEEDINSFISDLKPLMLSGESNYILIFGQKTLYRYLMADISDNNMLSSIFSRNIHIPLLNKSGFEKYFISLIGEENYENEIVKKYLDSNILLSNRIFRKFISIIRNDIHFDDNGKTYLEIDENDKVMLTNATISLGIYQVEEEILRDTKDNIEEGVRDFLVSNLYIAIKNMRRKQFISFGIDDILKSKDFIDDEFASVYLIYVRENIQSLINKMVEKYLLEEVKEVMKGEKEERASETMYKWTDNAELGKFDSNPYAYLDEFIRFERWLKDFSYQVRKYILHKPTTNYNSAMQIIHNLANDKLISKGVVEEFKYVHKIRNKIAHGVELSDFEKESLITFNRDLKNVKVRVFEELMTSAVYAFNSTSVRNIQSNELINTVDAVVDDVAFEFKVFEKKDSIIKFLNGLEPIKYINNINETRILILLDGEIDRNTVQRNVESIEKNTSVRIKIIEEIEMFELQDFLKIGSKV